MEKHLSLFHYLLTSDYYEENVDEGRIHQTFYLPYFIFDYFNKINIMVAADRSYIVVMLSRSKPTNNSRILYIEIQMLHQKLNQLFGKDIDDLGLFNRSEIEEGSWKGRKWQHRGYEYSLKITNGYTVIDGFKLINSIKIVIGPWSLRMLT
ncbi:hypothetical protein SIO70_23105 [Chitinophaga sancti]|uniref:hypothetical protein n=1 Tax=Chitinophaga sancti TaxID=1004 RepID=UPI002A759ED2|nr:hypothetical protein [Chitinophaga sancti]WPQ61252.1 hypothetical protein SIO70_23105 [Chitinophaga sancti]